MPLRNISSDPNDEYFADGLTEELITVLSQVKGLRVIARTSVSRYKGTDRGVKEIGSELRVGSVLEGSVRKTANKVRVTAQLIDVASEEHIWADKYDRDLDDVFLIQSDIAKHVSEELRIKLHPEEEKQIDKRETQSVIAHVAYLKGRTLLHDRTEKGIRDAQEQFELAIKHDPHYARAYTGLADVHLIFEDLLMAPPSESRGKAGAFVKKALELDPDLPEAHVSLASILDEEYRFADAEKEYKQAIALTPSYAQAHHWYCILLRKLGRADEALQEISLAEELDPLSPSISQNAFMVNLYLENWNDVETRAERIRETEMDNPYALVALIVYHLCKAEYEQALECCARLKQLSPNFPVFSPEDTVAYIYAVTGRRSEAIEILNILENKAKGGGPVLWSDVAFVYLGLNDLDGCFNCLGRSLEDHERTGYLSAIRYLPMWSKAKSDPRFNNLLRRFGLPAIS